MNHAVILGTGSYLPKRQVSNLELESQLDTSDEWIATRTGIRSRHIADKTKETTSFMAAQAAQSALKAAQISADNVDLIIVATCTPDEVFPSVACRVQAELNIQNPIPAFDISAACSGFVYAMDIANQYIKAGNARHVLVIGSETMSKTVDWSDRSTCVLFGDGAGAVIVGASAKRAGIIGSVLHAKYDKDRLLTYQGFAGNEETTPWVCMRGNEVFKLAVNIMGEVVDEMLEKCQRNKSDIHWLIPHQANHRIIQAIAKKLNLPLERVVITVEKHGNTSAASIPIAIDVAVQDNRLQPGDLFLIESFGGGMTWGAMLIQY